MKNSTQRHRSDDNAHAVQSASMQRRRKLTALSVEIDESTKAERRTCVRTLLFQPIIVSQAGSNEIFALIRRHSEWLKHWFSHYTGWSLFINSELARLNKTAANPSDASRPCRDLKNGAAFSKRRYVLLCLALSHPLLVCNLHLAPSHPLSNILESAYELAEPTYLTIRQLSRFPIQTKEDCRSAAVYVCENPAVISANIETNGHNSKPLLCTSGNLTSSAQILLRQLSKAGIEIYYHGDFDWPGLKIANYVIKEFRAIPWRMDHVSYTKAKGEKPLVGAPVDSPWEPKLKAAMLKKGTAVYEEQVVETLLTDLRL